MRVRLTTQIQITNYWEKMDKDLEIQQGKTVADIAKVSLAVTSSPITDLGIRLPECNI